MTSLWNLPSYVRFGTSMRHLLTACRLPTIVREMTRNVSFGRKSLLVCNVKIGLCLLLAILFLYNPFLATTSSSNSLNIRHTASYRATVASSELQQFSPTDKRATLVLAAALFTRFEFCLNSSAEPPTVVAVHRSVVSQFLYANLYFRPPPAMQFSL